MAQTIQLRRGIAAAWTVANPILNAGEVGFETDTGKFKVGDGATAWTILAYAIVAQFDEFGNLTGTANQITVTGGTNAVAGTGTTLSLPQDIHTGAVPEFVGLVLTSGQIDTSVIAPSDLEVSCGADKTIELQTVVWDDMRITPGSFDRPGISDPAIVVYAVGGGGINSYLYEFAKNNVVSFTVQMPHSYKTGQDIKVHVHWTPGANGVAENGNTVGWKVDYSWANINGAFGAMATADLSDACNGVAHAHQMTPEVIIDGHTAAKDISSMLICNLKRTDTGADDTWAGVGAGNLPLLLEIDFHFPIDTMGSRQVGVK